jgi:deferrochelatase/peroxidase EfeB
MDDIKSIEENLTKAQATILNPQATFTELVQADVDAIQAEADLERIIDLKRDEISLRETSKDMPEAGIKRIWKNETIEARRLVKIADGFLQILKQKIYRESK